jgi:hypothetical protein
MKVGFIFLIIACANFLFAQEHPIINSKYPYEIAKPQHIPGLMPGNYLVRTDADYFNLLNPDPFHPLYVPDFPLYGGTGVILNLLIPKGSYDCVIKSIVETDYNVIINVNYIKGKYYRDCPSGNLVFLRLRKTYKEILVSEETEQFEEEEPPSLIYVISY